MSFVFSVCAIEAIDNCDWVTCESETKYICLKCNGDYGPLIGKAYRLGDSEQICIRKIWAMYAPYSFRIRMTNLLRRC